MSSFFSQATWAVTFYVVTLKRGEIIADMAGVLVHDHFGLRIPINPATHSDLKAATHSDTNPATHSDLKAARGQLPNRSVTVIAWQGF